MLRQATIAATVLAACALGAGTANAVPPGMEPTDPLSMCQQGSCSNSDKLGNFVCASFYTGTDTTNFDADPKPAHAWACREAMAFVRANPPMPIGPIVSGIIVGLYYVT